MSPDDWRKVSAALDELIDLPEERRAARLQRLRAEDPPLCQEVESLLKQRDPTARLDAPPPLLGTPQSGPCGAAAPAADATLGPLLDRQRDGWARGEGVPVEKLVEEHPTLRDDRERLLDLVWNEVDLRAARGETPRLEEYQQRFPELADDLRKQFEVFAALEPADRTLSAGRGAETPVVPRLEGYEILGELGRGGMGVVYQARQTALGRVVAVKMILPAACADAEELRRFRAEAEAVARLQHPNIIQIHQVGEQDGRPFLVLEFAAGGGLDKQLAGTPMPADRAARLVETLARAVHHAHEKGVIHRDLKPSNVLLAADGTPKITDFGLAKVGAGLPRPYDDAPRTQTGAVMGTPSYMSPEQAAGLSKQIGPAADVYALGAILYECLTGRPPFKAPVMLDTLVQVRNDEPVPPRRLQSKTPRDLETICLKCLQKDPKRRYSDAAALAEDLRRYQAGEPIAARPAGRPERLWRRVRRNPKDAALVAAGLLAVVLAAGGCVLAAGARQAEEQQRRDRQARATAEAERKLTDARALWERAKAAAVGDLVPWERATAAAEQAQLFIDQNAVEDATRSRVEQTRAGVAADKRDAETKAATAARDAKMKAALEELAVNQELLQTIQGQGVIVPWSTERDRGYARAFAEYGVDPAKPEEAAARIRGSALEPELIAALEAWIPLRQDLPARGQVRDLVNRVSEPDDFHRVLRDALVLQDYQRLGRLARSDLSAFQPAVIGRISLDYVGAGAFEDAVALLRPAQERFPSDYLINYELAFCLGQLKPPRPDEEIRFYTAAVAIRPDLSVARVSLGNVLTERGRLAEAAAEYRTACGLDRAENPFAPFNLGIVLWRLGRLDESAAAYRSALARNPRPETQAAIQDNLGFALWEAGRMDDAAAAYRAAAGLNDRDADAQIGLGAALLGRGEFKEALDAYHRARDLLPPADPRRASGEDAARRADRLRLLGEQLDAILQGGKKPAGGAEGVDCAYVCLYRRYPAAAARLFRDAFTAAPDLAGPNRWDATRAAALAGAGQGQDAGSTTEAERAAGRAQALDRLRTDLKGVAPKTQSPSADERLAAGRQLRVWQNHVDLAGVRDDAALKALPADEQGAWRQFWTDVSAAADRAERP